MSDRLSQISERAQISLPAPGAAPRVMIVDDEPANISILADALGSDHDLVIATSATDALALLETGDLPHLILLDIMMPDMDGLEMCRQLKAQRRLKHIPVIFVTAMSDSAAEEQGFDAGGVDFIQKPIRLPAVRARVRTHISLRGMLDHIISLNHELENRIGQFNRRLLNVQNSPGLTQPTKDLFENVFMATSEGIVLLDAKGITIAVNTSFSRITGYSEAEVIGHSYEMLDKYPLQMGTNRSMLEHLRHHDNWSGEIYNRKKTGVIYPELRSVSVIRSSAGDITHYVSVFNDVSNLKETEQRLEELTWRDPVTDLPNRAMFMHQLDTVLRLCERDNVATTVVVIDIKNFHYINETLGFECGDQVIRKFALRLQSAISEDDVLGRLSGDEFGVVLTPKLLATDDAYGTTLALYERIQLCLADPITSLAGVELRLDVTIGAVFCPAGSSDTPVSALQHAEIAHRRAKAEQRPFVIYRDSMSEHIRRQLLTELQLNRAIEQNELILFAQPQFLPNQTLSGLEILLRWNHPERGIVGSDQFIPQVEQSRQIIKIERYLLQQALASMVRLLAVYPGLRCSVKISARHFAEDDFVEAVTAIIAASDAPARFLTLGLTESVTIRDIDTVVQKMDALRALGCEFSLHDLGTGYSSLSQLRRLPISEVRIDRNFVIAALKEPMSANIVEMLKRMGETMGARVVAEGVETQAHADFLAHHHPHVHLQGSFFGEPKAITEFMNPTTEPPL